jgi:ribosomal protein S1
MENSDNETELIIRTINGKRMVYTEDGKIVKGVLLTKEKQDIYLAIEGKSEMFLNIICKCE